MEDEAMKHFRISIDVDIKAKDREHAEQRAHCLCSDFNRIWIVEVLPNGIEERIPIASRRQAVVKRNDNPAGCPSTNLIKEQKMMTETVRTIAREKHLPPDPEGMNDDRSSWADASLRAFRKATRCDREDALGDLLADLIHWSDRNQSDFDAALVRARMHYEAETSGEEVL
jgi:hypothetical protein